MVDRDGGSMSLPWPHVWGVKDRNKTAQASRCLCGLFIIGFISCFHDGIYLFDMICRFLKWEAICIEKKHNKLFCSLMFVVTQSVSLQVCRSINNVLITQDMCIQCSTVGWKVYDQQCRLFKQEKCSLFAVILFFKSSSLPHNGYIEPV